MTRRSRPAGFGVVAAIAAAWVSVSAAGAASAQSPGERYRALIERERPVLAALRSEGPGNAPSDEDGARADRLTSAFENITRRFPTSGYADDALWHAATLADAAYEALGRPTDRDRAVRYLRWLAREYPTSPLVKRAATRAAALSEPKAAERKTAERRAAAPAPVRTLASPPEAATPAPVTPRATLLNVQRVTLADSVRITLELDQEVLYREERLARPARVFFDLKAVQLPPALVDKVLTYTSDVVRLIRVGRHPNSTVRVVLDLEDVSRYSVFTLYSPFRVVIDCERKPGAAVALRAAAAPIPPPLLEARTFVVPSEVSPAASSVPSAPPVPLLDVSPLPAPLATVAPTIAMASALPAAPAPEVPPRVVTPAAANATGGYSMARQLGLGVSRVVIDPGHGGHDPGAQAPGLNEADLVLDVALRLERLLKRESGLDVVLTRRTNVYVPLTERTAIANRQNADLFVSVHANASRNEAAKGIETYFLSFASSPEAEAVAARENAASEREMHHLPDLVKAIALGTKLDESQDLANIVQESLITRLRRTNKDVRSLGVKRAPFVVLIGASMPSVLAEISFITNRQELQLLKTASYKDRIAEALQAAVLRYRQALKGQPAIASP